MIVKAIATKVEGGSNFHINNGKTCAAAGKIVATNLIKNLEKVFRIDAKNGNTAVSKNPNAAQSTIPNVIIQANEYLS